MLPIGRAMYSVQRMGRPYASAIRRRSSAGQRAIIVEADHVRLREHVTVDRREPGRDRIGSRSRRRPSRAASGAASRAQSKVFPAGTWRGRLAGRLEPAVAGSIGVVRLVEEVPGVNADRPKWPRTPVTYPLTVVPTSVGGSSRRGSEPIPSCAGPVSGPLFARLGERVPDSVEEDKHHADLVPIRRRSGTDPSARGTPFGPAPRASGARRPGRY